MEGVKGIDVEMLLVRGTGLVDLESLGVLTMDQLATKITID